MAFALAAALARKHAPGEIKEIHLKGSGLMVTGVQAVLIPNSHGRRRLYLHRHGCCRR